jgi:hypothetical protein
MRFRSCLASGRKVSGGAFINMRSNAAATAESNLLCAATILLTLASWRAVSALICSGCIGNTFCRLDLGRLSF